MKNAIKRNCKLFHSKWAEMLDYTDVEPIPVLEGEPVVLQVEKGKLRLEDSHGKRKAESQTEDAEESLLAEDKGD